MMKSTKIFSLAIIFSSLSLSPIVEAKNISIQKMADALFAVIEADRSVYTKNIVQRLQNEDEVITADEHWKEESALILPAQMLRLAAERVNEKKVGFNYSLVSIWAINKQNKPRTDFEVKALNAIKVQKKNFYGEESLAGKKYFTAVYPDVAVSKACISCHNDHIDSPRKDFKLGDVMGGLVIRIPLDD